MSQRIAYTLFGGPEILELGEAPELTPGPAQVRVRLAGVNRVG